VFIHNVFDLALKGLFVNRVICICWLKKSCTWNGSSGMLVESA